MAPELPRILALFPLAWKPDARHRSVIAQAGFLSHADTVDSLTLMAKEIIPRLKEHKQPEAAQNAAA